jgi:hypothetical protein
MQALPKEKTIIGSRNTINFLPALFLTQLLPTKMTPQHKELSECEQLS